MLREAVYPAAFALVARRHLGATARLQASHTSSLEVGVEEVLALPSGSADTRLLTGSAAAAEERVDSAVRLDRALAGGAIFAGDTGKARRIGLTRDQRVATGAL